MLITRVYLARENRRRELEKVAEKNVSEEIYILDVDGEGLGDGLEGQKVVDKVGFWVFTLRMG